MVKKCLYCNKEIDNNSVIDFCESCGINVFGTKLLKTIIENMSNAREKGDLMQGSVFESSAVNSQKNTDSEGKQNFLKL